jgi:hypothetical protein
MGYHLMVESAVYDVRAALVMCFPLFPRMASRRI